MFARLALETDRRAVIDLARMQVQETLPHLDFHASIAWETFDAYLASANPTFFVAEDRGNVVGYLMALMNGYAFTTGLHVVQEVLYVKPDKRGGLAAALLVKAFVAWGTRVGARELFFGISNGFQPERTARFFRHFGAEVVGYSLKLVPAEDT